MSVKNRNTDAFIGGVLLGLGLGIISAAIDRNRYANSVHLLDDGLLSLDADTRHLSSDWRAIGGDFRVAMDKNLPIHHESQQED